LTIGYGTEVNATATSVLGTESLFRNNTNVDSENGINITLASGYYEYKANSTGNANYSSDSVIYYLNVTKATPVISLIADEWEVVTGHQSNVTCSVDNPQTNISLYRNGTLIGSSLGGSINDTGILGIGNYTYVCNSSESQNYTTASETNQLNVTGKLTTVLTLEASPSWDNTYPTETTVSCSANHEEATPVLYLDDVNVSNPYVVTHPAGSYNYSCNITETVNYLSAQNSSMMNIGQGIDTITLYLNGVQDNLTIGYGTEVNASATSISGTHNLFRNNTDIDTENGINITLA